MNRNDDWAKTGKLYRPDGKRWPQWEDMDGTGKFVTVMFWLFVFMAVGNLLA